MENERHLKGEVLHRPARDRGALLAAFVALLVFAVGIGSGRSLAHVGGPARLLGPRSYLGDLLVVALAVFAVVFAAIAYSAWPDRRRRRADDEPRLVFERQLPPWWTLLLSGIAAAAAAAGLIAAVFLLFHHASKAQLTPVLPTPSSPRLPQPPQAATSPHSQLPLVHWWGLAGVAIVVLVAAAVLLRNIRRGPLAGDETPDEAGELRTAIEISLDDIEREPDPRRAVIRAYARMEVVLARHGLERRPFETSLEYLRRALAVRQVSNRAVERLTELFERAKFSSHEIDMSMKRDALVALVAVRDELEEAR